MKKITIILIFVSSSLLIFSEGQRVELDLLKDSVISLTTISVNLPKLLMSQDFSNLNTEESSINFIDTLTSFTYNRGIDDFSTYLAYALLVSPSIFLLNEDTREDIFVIGAIYVESFFLANGLKDTLKTLFPKYRPYMYNGSKPNGDEEEYSSSFPSGHTSLAFMTAGFITAITNIYDLDNSFKIPLITTSYALATTVGVMRIVSGAHFTTDVITGALLGSVVGYTIPLIHIKKSNIGVNLSYNGNLGLLLSGSF